jgi:lysine 2,3-aminomutase
VAKGIEIIEALRGHTSGYAIPTFVVDAPGGGGKIPLGPNYLVSMSDHKIVLRNYEGLISTYEEPTHYQMHDPKTCSYCQNKKMEPGQNGVSGLLDGEDLMIKPEGFDALHNRGGGQHRLRADPDKWKPLGIGDGDY